MRENLDNKLCNFASSLPTSLLCKLSVKEIKKKQSKLCTLLAFIRPLNNAFCVVSLIAFEHTENYWIAAQRGLESTFPRPDVGDISQAI